MLIFPIYATITQFKLKGDIMKIKLKKRNIFEVHKACTLQKLYINALVQMHSGHKRHTGDNFMIPIPEGILLGKKKASGHKKG